MDNYTNTLDEGLTNELGNNQSINIYSEKAIWGFSIFFTTIFGGVLLMQNLRDIGKKKEASLVLILSCVYTALTIFLINLFDRPNTSITFLFNAAGGLVLTKYFFVKYFPKEHKYQKKKIWKPLIISIIILIPFVWAAIYTLNHKG